LTINVDERRQNTENTSNDPSIKDNNGDDEDGGGNDEWKYSWW